MYLAVLTSNCKARCHFAWRQGKVEATEAPEKGIPWLQRALLNAHRDAAKMLGQMHMSGHLLPMDSERALHYMKIVERLTPEGEEEECD